MEELTMRRPSFANRKLVALAMLAGAAGACSPAPEEDASNATGQEEYVQQIQTELDNAAISDPSSFNNFKPVKPVLKCVDKLANNQYKAHFGYTNSSSSSISIPVGFFNRFWPPPISRGQPTVFAPGSQADVVQVTFSGFSASIWVLGNHFTVATRFSKLCPAGGTGGAPGTGGRGTGGVAGNPGTGGVAGNPGMGGRGTGGVAGNPGTGGVAGNPGTGGVAGNPGTGGVAGNNGTGGVAGNPGTGGVAGNNGTGGVAGNPGTGGCMVPTNCDDQNPCTVDGVDSAACTCTHFPVLDGANCDDGNACTTVDSCQAGACVGGSPKTCTALDQCHIAGVCDRTTGACSQPAAPDGRTCSDNNACTVNDICVSGICTMGSPVLCNAPDQCHSPGTCDRTTGACSNPSAPDGTTCNDQNACSTGDACKAGVCGGAPVVCTAADSCHIPGVCNPANGTCSVVSAPNGATCTDNNACTTGETCQAGVCTGGTTKACTATDSCHVAGTCDSATGTCSNPAATDGTTCTDNNACTTGDSCKSGSCVPGAPIVCTGTSDACHTGGICNPATGMCASSTAPDGTMCDDGKQCTTGDVCRAGVCTPTTTVPADHCDPLSCEQCTFGQQPGQADLCDSSPDGCFNCDPSTMGCDLLTDPNDKILCQNLYACLVAPTHPGDATFPNFCISAGGDPIPCWCGSNSLTCVQSNAPPTQANGPCLQQIFAAAKTTDAATINARFIDPTFPLGAAANLAICRGSFCPSECVLPH
jgi:hypothetical protein